MSEDPRTGMQAAALQRGVVDHLCYSVGCPADLARPHHYYHALALAVRDRMQAQWMRSTEACIRLQSKVACYLSAEFLLGPQLGNNLLNLGLEQAARTALTALGQDLDAVLAHEEEPGLGNGGLGRLAACYLDSLASLRRPAIGYGIRYEFGMFDQEICDGWQREVSDNWLRYGNPWEIHRPEVSYDVKWGGQTEHYLDDHGRPCVRWVGERTVRGTPYDTPIQGYAVEHCNTLRLWSAQASQSLDLQAFNAGDYYAAVRDKMSSETITKVLYPNDEPEVGKRLRLLQQYFFVSCSLQDMLRLAELAGEPVQRFADRFAIQLNDTHPSIGVAELMRLLVDEHGIDWDDAWAITVRTFGYTNHTLLPEALETWPLPLFAELLPRHLEIIYEINRRFLDQVRVRFPDDDARAARMSLIDESNGRRVRMAHLATVGSHAVNGVAALHSQLLRQSVLRDFHEMWPERFSNKTNGVTPRRFLALANPPLRALLDELLGPAWPMDLALLKGLEAHIGEPAFLERWRQIKLTNKQRLANYVRSACGVSLDPSWLFDVQVKRIHEYKRQHLNVLHILTLYLRLKRDPRTSIPPRAFIFGGKAAPGYDMAKRIIKLITAVGQTINTDPDVNRYLKVAFVPNFNVQNAELIYPAADVSEQISTAGKEASGTGNMKFMMNGAITIGTLDGANVEMREEVGRDNFFSFGMDAEQVERRKRDGYWPERCIEENAELRAVLGALASGELSGGDPSALQPLVHNLRHSDPFLVLADYADYVACQERMGMAWRDADAWTRMSILNTARSGKFSSDRAIAEYCSEIWNVTPLRLP